MSKINGKKYKKETAAQKKKEKGKKKRKKKRKKFLTFGVGLRIAQGEKGKNLGKRVYIKKLIEYNTKYYKGHARKNKKSIHKKLKKCNFCFLKLLHELGKCSTIKMWKNNCEKRARE